MTVKRGDVLALVLDHVGLNADGTERDEDAFTPSGEAPARYGARELSDTASQAIAEALVERDVPRRVWPSPEAAVRAYASQRDEGASLRSTSDPDRANRVQTSKDPSLGGREHDAVERTAGVAMALEEATRRPLALSAACPLLTPTQCRDVYMLTVVGRIKWWETRTDGKAGCYMRETMSLKDVVMQVSEAIGVDIGQDHVRAICSHYHSHIREELTRRGEMLPVRPREPVRRGFAADPGARVRGES